MQLTPAYNVIRNVYKPRPIVKKIDEVSEFLFRVIERNTGITKFEIKMKSRKREIINAKRIYSMLMYNYTDATLVTIGLLLGGHDHSSIIHHLNSLNDLIAWDSDYKKVYQNCELAVSSIKNKVRFK